MPYDLFEKMEKYRAAENLNRSSYVMEAVAEYTKKMEREYLRIALEKESKLVRAESLKFAKEMEGLDDHLID